MKLTNLDRDAFIRAVMEDVPRVDYQEQARSALQKWAVAQLPPKLKALHKEFGHWFATQVLYNLPGQLSTVAIVSCDRHASETAMKADTEFWSTIVQIASNSRAQTDARKALESKVKACIYSCTTDVQAHERMPEFALYLKTLAPKGDRTVPVVANLVADLNAAGWPKGKKPVKKAAA